MLPRHEFPYAYCFGVMQTRATSTKVELDYCIEKLTELEKIIDGHINNKNGIVMEDLLFEITLINTHLKGEKLMILDAEKDCRENELEAARNRPRQDDGSSSI